jgi:hypothetical protein
MRGRVVLPVIGLLATALVSAAASAEPLAVCEQSLEYHVEAPGPQVQANMRAFSGVWVGKWDSGLCGALVVESVQPDGTAGLLYINGSMGGQYPVKAGNRRFPGKIVGNKLTAAGQTVTVEYVQRSPTELAGSYTTQSGRFSGSFARR